MRLLSQSISNCYRGHHLFRSARYIVRRCLIPANKMSDSDPRFTLYMSGTSYYAQKVMLAFFAKNEAFTEKLVNQRADDNYAPWYMRLTPKGQVPVMGDKGEIIPESDVIIDYLDKERPQAPRLVPDTSTELGQEVARFRKLLNISVGVIIHGLAYNPQFMPDGKLGKTKAELDAQTDGKIAKLEQLAEENPDLRDAYLAKIPPLQDRKLFSNPEVVKKALDDLQTILDEVETRLVRSAASASGNTWLVGSDYTAADAALTVLLRRLQLLGVSTLYYTPDKRPTLYKYWMQLQDFPPYCKLGDIVTKYGVVA